MLFYPRLPPLFYTDYSHKSEFTFCLLVSPLSWWTVVKHLCWSLLGIAELETLESVDSATVTLAHLLYGIFLVVGVILLVNMMIALLSNTYQRVEVRNFQFLLCFNAYCGVSMGQ